MIWTSRFRVTKYFKMLLFVPNLLEPEQIWVAIAVVVDYPERAKDMLIKGVEATLQVLSASNVNFDGYPNIPIFDDRSNRLCLNIRTESISIKRKSKFNYINYAPNYLKLVSCYVFWRQN